MWLAARKANRQMMEALYAMGGSFLTSAMPFLGADLQSIHATCHQVTGEDVLRKTAAQQRQLATDLRRFITGEDCCNKKCVKPLFTLAIGAIRDALARDGKNIKPEVAAMVLPAALQLAISTVEWPSTE